MMALALVGGRRWGGAIAALAVALCGARAAAQSPAGSVQAPVSATADSPQTATAAAPTPGTEQQDVLDYYRRWRKKPPPSDKEQSTKRAMLLMPILGSKPSTGSFLGVGATFEKPRGSLDDTYVSSTLVSAWYSTKQQYAIALRPAWFGAGNDWLVSGDNHFQKAGQDTYGLGTGAPDSAGVSVRYRSLKFIDSYYREIWRGAFLGMGLQYQQQSDVKPLDEALTGWEQQPYYLYSTQAGFDPVGQTAAGLSIGLRHDSRDNVSDPDRGWFSETLYRAYMADFLGGDSTWQRLYVDLRKYQALTPDHRHKLAFWTYGDFVTHGTAPYLSLPATGTDTLARSGRGYAEGRFRGDKLLYGEVEYRMSFTRDGVVGMVAFLNATTVGSTFTGERLFDSVAVGGGFGLRARLQKRSRTNICLDFGFGREGSHGVYIGLAEAF
jgi:hypothetical protein